MCQRNCGLLDTYESRFDWNNVSNNGFSTFEALTLN